MQGTILQFSSHEFRKIIRSRKLVENDWSYHTWTSYSSHYIQIWPSPLVGHNTKCIDYSKIYVAKHVEEHIENLRNMLRTHWDLMRTYWELHGNNKNPTPLPPPREKRNMALYWLEEFLLSTIVLCHRSLDLPLLTLRLDRN